MRCPHAREGQGPPITRPASNRGPRINRLGSRQEPRAGLILSPPIFIPKLANFHNVFKGLTLA